MIGTAMGEMEEMMTDKFILDGHEPVPEPDVIKWGQWFQIADRCVARTMVEGIRISTVFLGLDHSFGEGQPMLFETLVFDGPLDDEMDRYLTWDEAVAGHAAIVERVKAAHRKGEG